MYAIGITQFIDEATLKFLSSSPQEKDNNYFISPDFNGLQNILDTVLQNTCGATPAPTTTPARKHHIPSLSYAIYSYVCIIGLYTILFRDIYNPMYYQLHHA